MSAQHAIAAVTQVLRNLLLTPVDNQVAGATVTVGPPDVAAGPAPDNRVNLFLYRVSPNAALRSVDLPTRRSSGQLARRPAMAVDLHYLVSCFGDEPTLVPQRLLGTVLSTLHATPMLTRDQITTTLAPPDPLADSGLEEQIDLVKFQLESISNEDLSRLWSTLLQSKYALSATYLASTVVLEEPLSPVDATPVEERRVFVRPAAHPRIDAVVVDGTPRVPITIERTLLVQGVALGARPAEVWFGDASTTTYEVIYEGLRLDPPSSARAGLVPVRVVQPQELGEGGPSDAEVSNTVSIHLRPVIDQLPSVAAGVLSVDLVPDVHLDQTATLRLDEEATGDVTRLPVDLEQARILAGLPAGTTQLSTVMVQLPSLPAGTYRVRFEVDGLPNAGKADGSVPPDPEVTL